METPNQLPSSMCRGCGFADCDSLGRLPDKHHFAGLTLPYEIPGGMLFRCPKCNLVFRSPILTIDQYNQLYAQASAELWQSKTTALRRDQELVKAYIETQRPQGARVLDIGCYTGEFLSALPHKYQKFGIEKCVTAIRQCEESGIRIVCNDLYAVDLVQEKFDIVTAIDVIEHTANPSQFLQCMFTVLSDDGIGVITTGDADNRIWRKMKSDFWYCSPAEHISFISERWLKSNASVNDFRIANFEKFRYRRLKKLKTLAKLALIYGLPLVGIQSKTWNADLSPDHLFAALCK